MGKCVPKLTRIKIIKDKLEQTWVSLKINSENLCINFIKKNSYFVLVLNVQKDKTYN